MLIIVWSNRMHANITNFRIPLTGIGKGGILNWFHYTWKKNFEIIKLYEIKCTKIEKFNHKILKILLKTIIWLYILYK